MHQKSDVPSHGPVCGGLTARVYLGIGWKGLVDEYFISYMDPSTNRHEHQIKRTLNCRQLSNPKNDVFSLYLSDNLFVPGDSPPLKNAGDKLKDLDEKHDLKAQAPAVLAKAKELDAKHEITQKAKDFLSGGDEKE